MTGISLVSPLKRMIFGHGMDFFQVMHKRTFRKGQHQMAKASKHTIPESMKEQANEIVKNFNENVIKDSQCYYTTRYRGTYLYLDRYDYGTTNAICRLRYTGNIKDWEFAIFKYSNEKYDPDEWFFAGSEFVNGTIQGAMKAGLQAYPG